MDIKDGLRTTEFWLVLAVIVATGVLVFTGKVANIQEAIALAGGLLAAAGYAIGRGNAKTPPSGGGK